MEITSRQARDFQSLLNIVLHPRRAYKRFSQSKPAGTISETHPTPTVAMTRLILSTANIMGVGPSAIRRNLHEKSNTELTSALRANFSSNQQASQAATNGENSASSTSSFRAWTSQNGTDLYIPALDFSQSGLTEERAAYDITVKLFYLPHVPVAQRIAHTRDAVNLVLKELHVPSIDLLIVSFPGIAFDADDEDSDADESGSIPNGGGSESESGTGVEDIDSMIETWRAVEALHDEGLIGKLGLSEFGSQRLAKFLAKARLRPSVDQINVRDCCVVPKPLILYAKQEGIELLTHNDCTNILPSGTVRELLGPGEKGAGVLVGSDGSSDGLKGDVTPQWVVKYTAVVKDRGVVENKGYFAAAELHD
ncbi:putative glutamate--cysteine ligase regulatory subunit [Lasiodiplodia theobromae]|uniref:GCS light chain n=1 Tax=Lasiodiplodia theobromae TaxID=45133 RepID=A0A5N5DK62_9PEZI|nr:putative glutamate--cysteine ligase regulatory subunit [Lasiodiplodia theobromae]